MTTRWGSAAPAAPHGLLHAPGAHVRVGTLEASAHGPDAAATQPIDAALARLEASVGDPEFVAELIGDFLAGLPGQLAALRSADAEEMYRIAHTLKSNAATFGADALGVACRVLEAAAADGAAGAHELIERVELEAARVTPALVSARDQRLPG